MRITPSYIEVNFLNVYNIIIDVKTYYACGIRSIGYFSFHTLKYYFDKDENCKIKGIMYSFKVYTNNVFALNQSNDQESKTVLLLNQA